MALPPNKHSKSLATGVYCELCFYHLDIYVDTISYSKLLPYQPPCVAIYCIATSTVANTTLVLLSSYVVSESHLKFGMQNLLILLSTSEYMRLLPL